MQFFSPSTGIGHRATTRRFVSSRLTASMAVIALIAGCATSSKDDDSHTATSAAQKRLDNRTVMVTTDADRDASAKRKQALLSKPLSMDDAAQLALLNDRGPQASRADMTKHETADAILKVPADARRAYVEAVAAEQTANYADRVKDSAAAGAELAARMRQAGNFSKLDAVREQAFYADSVVQAAKSRMRAVTARQNLTHAMGLWGSDTQYRLPDHLPDLPQARPAFKDLNPSSSPEIRESYSAYLARYDIAKHYRDEVVPLRKTISDEMQLRYNGMLVSVFDLLADSREQAAAVQSYIDALKDYWLAETDLQQALGGRLPQPAPATQTEAQ
jgi:outer membrane protein TolC